jgi:hypothetical protein
VKSSLAHIFVETLIEIILKLKVVLELFVCKAFVTHSIKSCRRKKIAALSNCLCIVKLRKVVTKIVNKFLKSFRQISYELLIKVHKIKKHIVANQGLFALYHQLYDSAKTKFILVE